jgi:ABC-type transporter Mla subunit MlaD
MTDKDASAIPPATGTAEIIAFPGPAPAVAPDGHERLRKAMVALEAAVDGQRAAVAEWRKALGDLRTTMSGLGDSMRRYRGNLDALGDRVGTLHAQARQLERTADTALALPSE